MKFGPYDVKFTFNLMLSRKFLLESGSALLAKYEYKNKESDCFFFVCSQCKLNRQTVQTTDGLGFRFV